MSKKKIYRTIALVSLLAFVLFCACAWVWGGKLLASANRSVGPAPSDLPVKKITIASDSGTQLATWVIPAEDAQASILLLHPIRADRRSMLGRAKLFHQAGYSIVMIDMQAHGESPGENITVGYLESHDVRAAVNYIRNTNPEHQIGIVGCSLGGAAALFASPLQIDAMVLESVYPTISAAVHNRVSMRLGPLSHVLAPVLLSQLRPRLGIAPTDLRPIEYINQVGCPVLVAGGDFDEHTTIAETKALFESAQEPKHLVVFAGAAHVDLLNQNPARYQEQVLEFLHDHLRAPLLAR